MKVTAFDLLMSAPDDQVVRMQLVFRRITDGDWAEAVHFLRNAVEESTGEWAAQAQELMDFCKLNAVVKQGPIVLAFVATGQPKKGK